MIHIRIFNHTDERHNSIYSIFFFNYENKKVWIPKTLNHEKVALSSHWHFGILNENKKVDWVEKFQLSTDYSNSKPLNRSVNYFN